MTLTVAGVSPPGRGVDLLGKAGQRQLAAEFRRSPDAVLSRYLRLARTALAGETRRLARAASWCRVGLRISLLVVCGDSL